MTMFCPTDMGPDEARQARADERAALKAARNRAVYGVSIRRLMQEPPVGVGTVI